MHTLMKIHVAIIQFFAIIVLAFLGHAETPDPAQSFCYPHATLVMTASDQRSATIFAKNALQPNDGSSPTFRGSDLVPPDARLAWELVRKTDYGDLYVFVLRKPGQKDSAFAVLFSGTSQTIVDKPGVKVELLPEPPSWAH